jgi:hypothetical protein
MKDMFLKVQRLRQSSRHPSLLVILDIPGRDREKRTWRKGKSQTKVVYNDNLLVCRLIKAYCIKHIATEILHTWEVCTTLPKYTLPKYT